MIRRFVFSKQKLSNFTFHLELTLYFITWTGGTSTSHRRDNSNWCYRSRWPVRKRVSVWIDKGIAFGRVLQNGIMQWGISHPCSWRRSNPRELAVDAQTVAVEELTCSWHSQLMINKRLFDVIWLSNFMWLRLKKGPFHIGTALKLYLLHREPIFQHALYLYWSLTLIQYTIGCFQVYAEKSERAL